MYEILSVLRAALKRRLVMHFHSGYIIILACKEQHSANGHFTQQSRDTCGNKTQIVVWALKGLKLQGQ